MTSLKYFCENAPEYHIIAAGSLLGVAMNGEKYSFPVGKVDMLTLSPLDFEEFLTAANHAPLAGLIKKSYSDFSPLSLHDTASINRNMLSACQRKTSGMKTGLKVYRYTHCFALCRRCAA